MTRNYAPLRRLIESRMYDTCTITRDAPGTEDDTLDQDTGVLTPPANDAATIYTGKCVLYPANTLVPRPTSEGARSYTEKTYVVRIPWDSPEPKIGDVLTVTDSANDAALINRTFRVTEVDKSSFLTSRDMVVEYRTSP